MVFAITYLLVADVFSYSILTDRILTAMVMVKKGSYPGLLDEAYNPIPFDIILYSFISLIIGLEPSMLIIFLMYPTIILSVLYIITWFLISYLLTSKNKLVMIMSFITVSLLNITCVLINITGHESLWTAWVLVALFIYLILKEHRKKTVFSSTLPSLLLIITAIFYHLTAIFVLLALIIISIYYIKKSIKNKNMIIYSTIVAIIFSWIKSIYQTRYTVKNFISLIDQILSLQLREEPSIYVRIQLSESRNIFLRYAQISPLLILSLSLVSLLFYMVKAIRTKQNIKTYDEFTVFVSLSLNIIGFLLLLLSILFLLIGGTYTTTFIRPALALLLLSVIPYATVKSWTICNHKLLFIAMIILYAFIGGLSINDPGLTPRKGLYSPLIYVHFFDSINLQFLQNISDEYEIVIGSPEISMYGTYLVHIIQKNINVISSTKNIREIYNEILIYQAVPNNLRKCLIISMNSIDLQDVMIILDSLYSRVYDSGFYIAHNIW
ncbi:hypothetical protein [Saccharolobus sp.]|uniref:hypothetical protein n=1 Tax=Saccharolobus sp. TaxID=2100761 RepID=UPI003178EB72